MIHKGLKSIDAEIILDLEKGEVVFDYSLNRFQTSGDSNNGCLLAEEGTSKGKVLKFIREVFILPWELAWFLIRFFAGFYGTYAISNPKHQHMWQKTLKALNEYYAGIIEESIIGKQECHILTFYLPNNVWFEYKLDSDYNSQIKKISLLRKFVKVEHLGITQHRQFGWNLVFEFRNPPICGYVTIKYLP